MHGVIPEKCDDVNKVMVEMLSLFYIKWDMQSNI